MRIDQRLTIHDLNLSSDADAIKAFCRKKAQTCLEVAEGNQYADTVYDWCRDLALRYHLTPPSPKDYQGDAYPCIKRLCSERWWRRQVIRLQRRTIESIARDLGLVCAQRSAYSSAMTRETRRRQKASSAEYLASTMLENDDGERFSLKELHDRSVSNPAVRRAELMTRINGFEMVAQHLGHSGEFYTLTAPSRMHARLKRGGKNPRYDGTTPDQAHHYLADLFRCIRAKLHREGLPVYGLRVVEPNHDGTPHWHLLLFMEPSHCEAVRRIFNSYALRSDPDERGARKHRFIAKAIDPTRGSAAGYVAKYVAKNIDGEYEGADITGQDSKKAACAIDAWASTFNIRQFQFIGGPSVTVWRELRRLSSVDSNSTPPLLQKAIEAADAAEWAAFVMIMGGPIMRKVLRPIQSLYDAKEVIDLETGEIREEAATAYGDPKPPRLIGLIAEASRVITRTKTWRLVPSGAPPQPCGHGDTGARRRPALDLCQ